jgi:serine/threonine protein kinase
MSEEKRVNRKFGIYTCIATLDVSDNSSLYHALNGKTGKMVMLRVLTLGADNKNPERMEERRTECLTEIKNMQDIFHPNIVPILDYGTEGRYVYYATPYIRGGNLFQRIEHSLLQRTSLPSLGQIATFVKQLGGALQFIHGLGMVHGQIEPRTILVNSGETLLADVGLMRLHKIIFHLDTTNSFSITRYSAPELWTGDKPEPASDQYALACIAYELLTGRAPFEAETLVGLMRSHLDEAVMPPNYVRPDLNLPGELAMVFWQALAKPPSRRFQNVLDFVQAFSTVVNGREGETSDFFTMPLSIE